MSCTVESTCAQNVIAITALVLGVLALVGVFLAVLQYRATVYSMVPTSLLCVEVQEDVAENEEDKYFRVVLVNEGAAAARIRSLKVWTKAKKNNAIVDCVFDVMQKPSLIEPFLSYCAAKGFEFYWDANNTVKLSNDEIEGSIAEAGMTYVIGSGKSCALLCSKKVFSVPGAGNLTRRVTLEALRGFINDSKFEIEVFVGLPAQWCCARKPVTCVDHIMLPMNGSHPGEVDWVRRETR